MKTLCVDIWVFMTAYALSNIHLSSHVSLRFRVALFGDSSAQD